MSYKLYLKMASTGIGFRWLDILEKEFDTNFVDLDYHLGELEAEDPEIVCNARHKMTALSSCFAQLTHKAQTIFQNSAKVEAELVNLRTELINAKAKKECLEQELHTVVLELHAAQLLNKLPAHTDKNNISNTTSGLANNNNTTTLEPQEVCRIQKKLQEELEKSPTHRKSSMQINEDKTLLQQLAHYRNESIQFQNENTALRNSILALHSEVYGARLAAKYLDKELAGRIQQLQLLGKEMRGDVRDKLWRQLESEILLQRHKTVVRACRRNNNHSITNGNCPKTDVNSIVPIGLSDTRLVTVKRNHGQGLGISITGGREHGVPILISELEPNGPAALSGQLYIGDAILSVNGIDLKQACHKEAVHVLQQQTGDCLLMVQYIAAEDSDTNSLSEDGYNFQYRFFDTEVCDSNDPINLQPLLHGTGAMANTPTAPRTPDFNEQSRMKKYSIFYYWQ
ncbi:Golgi-associated PDZ and coiled-coil motif-containing protein-like [Chrysoperla carnea]|uniref:Golgi-associated PDZ and coiled-coil motif-containing protein-like n=1 Tax=Chrysoperla carnea TaxID=189513 RepID=UPI001D076001|nr:Golgi-associated PDZ and coiled-coil motif-containing protein-like [Chrysoperla carnea]